MPRQKKIETVTPEGVSTEKAARKRDMLLDYVQAKPRKAQIAQVAQAQPPSKEKQ